MASAFELAIVFFLVTNPIGNSPIILALVKDFDYSTQKKILIREGIFALLVALFFQYFGEFFLTLIGAKDYALTLCGGTLLLLVALIMIFPKKEAENEVAVKQEPFLVPIATPLLAGPGLMTIIMINSKLEDNPFTITTAILLAFAGVIFIMAIAPFVQKVIGKRGLFALEQIMGMILALIATEMISKGIEMFINSL